MTIKKQQRKLLNILVSAGPTREPIDPVRFISNYSTGRLGYAIAQEAKRRGHRVILISGPTTLKKPRGILTIDVLTAHQMQQQLGSKFAWCDCLIMAAAVSDFRPKKIITKKIKRGKGSGIILRLQQNPDILKEFGLRKNGKFLVGFALETENLKQNAQQKLNQKNLDLIVATQIKSGSYPFGKTRINALIMDKKGQIYQVKKVSKSVLSRILLDSIEKTVL